MTIVRKKLWRSFVNISYYMFCCWLKYDRNGLKLRVVTKKRRTRVQKKKLLFVQWHGLGRFADSAVLCQNNLLIKETTYFEHSIFRGDDQESVPLNLLANFPPPIKRQIVFKSHEHDGESLCNNWTWSLCQIHITKRIFVISVTFFTYFSWWCVRDVALGFL